MSEEKENKKKGSRGVKNEGKTRKRLGENSKQF